MKAFREALCQLVSEEVAKHIENILAPAVQKKMVSTAKTDPLVLAEFKVRIRGKEKTVVAVMNGYAPVIAVPRSAVLKGVSIEKKDAVFNCDKRFGEVKGDCVSLWSVGDVYVWKYDRDKVALVADPISPSCRVRMEPDMFVITSDGKPSALAFQIDDDYETMVLIAPAIAEMS